MKLLFDQNISHRLTDQLKDEFQSLVHVRQVNISRAMDSEIWNYARKHDCMIVTKDSDFHQRVFLEGPPPKIIWIQLGNCKTQDIYEVIVRNKHRIHTFHKNEEEGLLTLP